MMNSIGPKFRKYSRIIHRDLSYLFAGMLMVYAISGIALNHKDTYNSQYEVSQHAVNLEAYTLQPNQVDVQTIQAILGECESGKEAIKHYFPNDSTLKIFVKGGSSLVVNLNTKQGVYESIRKRALMGALSKLHYNPGKAWTIFSDIFAISLFLIILTGLFMLKGRHGLIGWGGIELLIGILIPLLFLMI